MDQLPIDLTAALAGFEDLWSPRIVSRVNDYDVRIAKVRGEEPKDLEDPLYAAKRRAYQEQRRQVAAEETLDDTADIEPGWKDVLLDRLMKMPPDGFEYTRFEWNVVKPWSLMTMSTVSSSLPRRSRTSPRKASMRA
jgi:NADH:ubiquinone oxidoreductase subunit